MVTARDDIGGSLVLIARGGDMGKEQAGSALILPAAPGRTGGLKFVTGN
jgi:hypothetical protein